VRPRLDKVAVLIFRNGNLVCTGAKTFAQARYMLKRTAQMLRDIGYSGAEIVRMNIRNMVGKAQLPCRIDRERMAREIPAYATFDPAHFPGVSVKHPLTGARNPFKKTITLLVFNSGRIVITGTQSKPLADAALARIKPLLVHFDVNTPPGAPMPDVAWPGDVLETALYDVLGVDPKATTKEITAAFRKKALKMHPDKNTHLAPGTPEYMRVTIAYKRVSAAYELLVDAVLRDAYDNTGVGSEVIDVEEENMGDDADREDVAIAVAEAMTMDDLMEATKD
ncbi:MAG: DnaJ domain-containing protein, partial [Hyphomicrobiaceae bacterium]|nr:DnaJ domain-containing protein [Hyphomicrobiaceae bacterium]